MGERRRKSSCSCQDGTLFGPAGEGDNFRFERTLHAKGMIRVAGCDEAGRGPLAGPVVAAAVILPMQCPHSVFLDSKILNHSKRLQLKNLLHETGAAMGVGIVGEEEIDRTNILQASLLAMKLAVQNLPSPLPDFLLVDGKFPVPLSLPQMQLVKGESKSGSIAAASIVAKVTRDNLMDVLHSQYPAYNFAQNKGYPTREHRLVLAEIGPCPVHRMSFRGVREHVE